MPRSRRRSGRRRLGVAALALALCAAAGMALGGAAVAKKKSASVFKQTNAVNAAVPQDPGLGPSLPIFSTITVPKKFKGKVVGDLDVTGITTTGAAASSADDLNLALTAPNGQTVTLIGNGIGDVSIGPLTLDDDTRTSICDSATPTCADPNATLLQPFAGTANLKFLAAGGSGPLNAFDGGAMRGAWTLAVWDTSPVAGTTSTFNSWGLKITAAKPVKG